MKSRLAGAFALAAITGALVAGPAGAQGAPGLASYRASADAAALHISIAGNDLTLGSAESEVDSTPSATATGAGALTALASSATAEQPGGATTDGPNCSPLTLPDDVPLLDAATGCGSAGAAVSNGNPSSGASGEVAGLGLGVVDSPVPLSDIVGPVQEALDQLLDALAPVTDQLPIDLDDTLDELLEALTTGGDALSVEVGPASTETFADGEEISAKAGAAATRINVLNRDLLDLPPVLSIEVLPATAEVVRSQADGSVIRQGGTPAIVTIRVASDIATLTGLPQTIEIGTDEDLAALRESGLFDENDCLNPLGLPAPLDALVCLRLAAVDEYEDGNVVGVRATSLELRLLDSLFQAGGQPSGVLLSFADAVAEVEAVAGEAPRSAPTTPVVETERSLPRTGGGIPLGMTFGLAGAAAAGLFLVRRSRIAVD